MSPDASRFRLRNETRRADGEPARVTSVGGRLDLTEDFTELESTQKAPA